MKITVIATVRAAYGFTALNLGDLARIAALPALAAVLLWTGVDWWESQGHATSTSVVVDLVYAWFAFFWHRRILIGREAASMKSLKVTVLGDHQNKWFQRFIFRAIVYGAFVLLVLAVPTLLLLWQIADSVAPENLMFAMVFVVPLLYFPLSAFFLRFALMFPAIATGETPGWIDAWLLSRGNGWRLATTFAIAFLPFLPAFALCLAALAVLPDLGPATWLIENLLLAAVMFPLVAVQTACISFAYRDLTQISQIARAPEGTSPVMGTSS